MTRRLLPVLLLTTMAMAVTGRAAPWDALRQKSVSRSHQFIVYAGDPSARGAIAMDADHPVRTGVSRPITIGPAPASDAAIESS